MTKTCSICHQEKRLSEFYRDYTSADADAKRANCKRCDVARGLRRYRRLKAEGKCPHCGGSPRPGMVSCANVNQPVPRRAV